LPNCQKKVLAPLKGCQKSFKRLVMPLKSYSRHSKTKQKSYWRALKFLEKCILKRLADRTKSIKPNWYLVQWPKAKILNS
jgi:hypothetical protein